MALLIQLNYGSDEGLAITTSLDPAADEDIAIAPGGEDGQRSLRPESASPPFKCVVCIARCSILSLLRRICRLAQGSDHAAARASRIAAVVSTATHTGHLPT